MGKHGRLALMCHGEMGKDLEVSLLGGGGFGSDRRCISASYNTTPTIHVHGLSNAPGIGQVLSGTIGLSSGTRRRARVTRLSISLADMAIGIVKYVSRVVPKPHIFKMSRPYSQGV